MKLFCGEALLKQKINGGKKTCSWYQEHTFGESLKMFCLDKSEDFGGNSFSQAGLILMFCIGAMGFSEGDHLSRNREMFILCFKCLPKECRSVAKKKVQLLKHKQSAWENIKGARNWTRNLRLEKAGNEVRS